MEQTVIFGLVFAALAVGLPQVYNLLVQKKKDNSNKNKSESKRSIFSFISKRREKIKEKMKEIDEKLDEVASAGVKKEDERSGEKDDKSEIEEALTSKAEDVKIDEDILNEMQTGGKIEEKQKEEAEELPDVPKLPELDSTNSDFEIDTSDIDKEFKIVEEANSNEEAEETEKLDLEEKDDLISSLEKEITVEEEEEFDLLRDLKGQKFDVYELQNELQDVLEKLKTLKVKNK